MEADWEVEIGPDAPVVDAAWDGFVDLRVAPDRISEVAETLDFPALADALVRLNRPTCCVWTAKCDVWPAEQFDPDELDADPEDATDAMACYIDLIPARSAESAMLEPLLAWCKQLCLDLRARPVRQCRADVIVRRALFAAGAEGLATTLYVTGCGHSPRQAREALARALARVADSIVTMDGAVSPASKYNQNIVGE